jgi:GT2 family glycosyltransferase
VPTISVVVLAYLDEPWLERSVRSVLDSTGVDSEVVVVDNGCTDGAIDTVAELPRVRVLRPGRNLGFAGGCNAGAAEARSDFVGFLNSDAVVEPDALARLVAVADNPDVGIASGSIRLAEDPSLMNSAGNPLHFLGLVWAGGFGDPAAAHATVQPVACASGAGMVMQRSRWQQLGGFAPEYFAYHEDAELSLRCWQQSWRVMYVPDAVVVHRYEFSRNDRKYYLVERNRLLMLLTAFQARTLVLLAPALLLLELAMLALAARQGWYAAKVGGYRWLMRHRRWVRERRKQLQSERRTSDRDLAAMWVAKIDASAITLPVGTGMLNGVLTLYWAVVRRLL